MKIAFMFPGQGAQAVGMGKNFVEKYESANLVYEQASEVLKTDMKRLCFDTDLETLSKTENTQIAIAVNSLAILSILNQNGIIANQAVGLSLGEYTALIYGGYLDFEQGLLLLQKRGYYMGHCLPTGEFAMAAVMGLASSEIETVCKQIEKQGEFLVPANYNYSGQTVISGQRSAIEKAIPILKEKGAKKVVLLNTSGPFHTIQLKQAKEKFEKELEKVSFHKGTIPVMKNLDGTFYTPTDDMKQILANHIISPVRFDKAIQQMQQSQIDVYVEIGPGKALSGFVKKEIKDQSEARVFTISNVESLEQFLEQVDKKG